MNPGFPLQGHCPLRRSVSNTGRVQPLFRDSCGWETKSHAGPWGMGQEMARAGVKLKPSSCHNCCPWLWLSAPAQHPRGWLRSPDSSVYTCPGTSVKRVRSEIKGRTSVTLPNQERPRNAPSIPPGSALNLPAKLPLCHPPMPGGRRPTPAKTARRGASLSLTTSPSAALAVGNREGPCS